MDRKGKEIEITLKQEDSPVLEFIPVYKYKTHPTRINTFMKGINEVKVYLNGVCI
jgi:hypothetical protein